MATQSVSRDKQPSGVHKPLLPPEEKFWQRYSPRHELPLSSAMSIFAHGLAIGFILLLGWWMSLPRTRGEIGPPNLEVVRLAGEGSGLPGGGSPAGAPGPKGPVGPQEKVFAAKEPPKPEIDPPQVVAARPKFEDVIPNQIEAAPVPMPEEKGPDLIKEFQKLAKQATVEPNPPPRKPVPAKPGGGGGDNGGGGRGGKGGGTGQGDGVGPGVGIGGSGKPLTKQQIFAQRWEFDLFGTPRDHAQKLVVVGFTLAIQASPTELLVARDLKRRPVQLVRENASKYEGAVKWYNRDPTSVTGLARELRFSFVPREVILLLPKEREDKMAEAEAQFARQQGRDPQHIRKTWFDFQFRNGTFEPVVIRQE